LKTKIKLTLSNVFTQGLAVIAHHFSFNFKPHGLAVIAHHFSFNFKPQGT
jgi:hypothetical protein